ncbi:MAG: ornithine carbamoyltransferase [Phycisphaerales bacterium]|nr:ornithine carbamoyltransferase [Phycisphaerales bacterium]
MRHFLSILSTPADELLTILRLSISLRDHGRTVWSGGGEGGRGGNPLLAGKVLACLFEKPSLRTRVSFEQAMRKLGGDAMTLNQAEIGLGSRESVEDVSRVLAGMVDAIMARVSSHETLERMAAVSPVPVINGLSDLAHPAQALADLLTLTDEFSPARPEDLRDRQVVFVGDGNNVARSLAVACAKVGAKFTLCAPEGHQFAARWVRGAAEKLQAEGLTFAPAIETDPGTAVANADAVYCDTFVSMGQESERAARLKALAAYQVNERLMSVAPPSAIVMHCLPAHRGEEITGEVMDGPRSRVIRQAHNRMYAQMGLLSHLLAP